MTKNETKLPVWLNPHQAVAWVKYRDKECVLKLQSFETLAAEKLFGEREPVSEKSELLRALQQGSVKAYGLKKISGNPGEDWIVIEPVEWELLKLAPLEVYRQAPYSQIRIQNRELRLGFPPNSATKKNAPELSEHKLARWFEDLSPSEKMESQTSLHDKAKRDHPDNKITVRRIRELTPGRKRGPRLESE